MIPPKVYSSRGWSQSFIGFSLALQVGSYGRAQACFFFFWGEGRKHQTKITFHSKEWIFLMIYCQEKCGSSWVFPVWHPLSFKQWGIWAFSVAATLLARWGKMRSHFWGNKKGWWWIQRASKRLAIFIFSFFWLLLEVSLFKEKVNIGHGFVNKNNNNSSNNSNKKREGKKKTQRQQPSPVGITPSPRSWATHQWKPTEGGALDWPMEIP